jgi:hypothetical protein
VKLRPRILFVELREMPLQRRHVLASELKDADQIYKAGVLSIGVGNRGLVPGIFMNRAQGLSLDGTGWGFIYHQTDNWQLKDCAVVYNRDVTPTRASSPSERLRNGYLICGSFSGDLELLMPEDPRLKPPC